MKNFNNLSKTVITALIAALALTSCGGGEAETAKNTETYPDVKSLTESSENAETDPAATPETDAPETETSDTSAPEGETKAETEPSADDNGLPAQGDVPCVFDGALDLSGDILVSEFLLQENGGQWILGDDNTQMNDAITEDMLKEYKYFAFTYTCDDCDEDSEIALMCKFVHDDGTKSEVLCEDWFGWGPEGMTYHASSFAPMNVYGESGVFYVPTEAFLSFDAFKSGDIIDQIGLAGVEYSGTYVNLNITGAYLTK